MTRCVPLNDTLCSSPRRLCSSHGHAVFLSAHAVYRAGTPRVLRRTQGAQASSQAGSSRFAGWACEFPGRAMQIRRLRRRVPRLVHPDSQAVHASSRAGSSRFAGCACELPGWFIQIRRLCMRPPRLVHPDSQAVHAGSQVGSGEYADCACRLASRVMQGHSLLIGVPMRCHACRHRAAPGAR
jgi:hypothetical protein